MQKEHAMIALSHFLFFEKMKLLFIRIRL